MDEASKSAATHTPGPWRVEADGAGIFVLASNHQVVFVSPIDPNATDSNEFFDGAVTEANARLIAASPKLLAALKLCLAALERGEHCTKEQLDAALNEGHAACLEAGSAA